MIFPACMISAVGCSSRRLALPRWVQRTTLEVPDVRREALFLRRDLNDEGDYTSTAVKRQPLIDYELDEA